jgi:two-component system, NarL family, nitrate/nitrite response regulator NarL
MTAHSANAAMTTLGQADIASQPEPKVITALIGESALLCTGLQHILSETPFASASMVTVTGPDLHRDMTEPPALVIWVVSPPSGQTPGVIKHVKQHYPEARLVALADHFDLGFVQQGLDAGVNGFCLTGSDREVLITSLELVMLGESVLPGVLVRSVLDGMAVSPEPKFQAHSPAQVESSASRPSSLSAREAEILSSLMEGAPNKIIARKLHVAEATVKVHIKAILRKIGVTNRTQAAMWAKGHRHG